MKRAPFLLVLLLGSGQAFAQTVDPSSSAFTTLSSYTANLTSNLQIIGIRLFFSLALLQMVITGYGLIATGEIEATISKFAKSLIWISFCLWLMTNSHGANFVGTTVQYFLDHSVGWATGTQGAFDVNSIVQNGINAAGNTIAAVSKAAGTAATSSDTAWYNRFLSALVTTVTSPLTFLYSALVIGLVVITILATSAYVALKVFMVKIEAALVISIMPLSLAFLGLNAMRDQGFAPFKSMLALLYRILILAMVVGGMAAVGKNMLDSANSPADPNVLQVGMLSTFGFILMAFLAHKSDQIASSLASGSASLGSGDAVSSGMAGLAGLGVLGAAGAAGTAAAKGGVQSMSDFMKTLTTGSGSINNASSQGMARSPEPAPTRANASMPSQSSPAAPPKRNSPDITSSGLQDQNTRPTEAEASAYQKSSGESNNPISGGDNGAIEGTSIDTHSTQGSSPPATIGGSSDISPQRDMASELGRLADTLSAPKRKSPSEEMKQHLSSAAQHASTEKSSTSVSINTNHHD